MVNEAKFGVHEYGESLIINRTDPKTKECLLKIINQFEDVTEYITLISLGIMAQKQFTLPCK